MPTYDVQAVYPVNQGIFTNPPLGPYRGAGRPEATFLTERLPDQAAQAIGIDPSRSGSAISFA